MYRTVDNMTMATGDKVNLAWSFAGKVLPDHKKVLPEMLFCTACTSTDEGASPQHSDSKTICNMALLFICFFHFKGTYAC